MYGNCTMTERAIFLETAEQVGLDREAAVDFAMRINAKSVQDDCGRTGVRVIVRGVAANLWDQRPEERDQVIQVMQEPQARNLRLGMTAVWALYALRLANGIADARIR
jgi:hypothetical protein